MSVIVLKKINHIFLEIKKNTPIIIYKNFFKKNTCKKIIDICHENYSLKYNRKKSKIKKFKFAINFSFPAKFNAIVFFSPKKIFQFFEISR